VLQTGTSAAPRAVLVARGAERERHSIHKGPSSETKAAFDGGEWAPLDLGGTLIELDTSAPVDIASLEARISRDA